MWLNNITTQIYDTNIDPKDDSNPHSKVEDGEATDHGHVLHVTRPADHATEIGVHLGHVVPHHGVQQHQPQRLQVDYLQGHHLQQGLGARAHAPHLPLLLEWHTAAQQGQVGAQANATAITDLFSLLIDQSLLSEGSLFPCPSIANKKDNLRTTLWP